MPRVRAKGVGDQNKQHYGHRGRKHREKGLRKLNFRLRFETTPDDEEKAKSSVFLHLLKQKTGFHQQNS